MIGFDRLFWSRKWRDVGEKKSGSRICGCRQVKVSEVPDTSSYQRLNELLHEVSLIGLSRIPWHNFMPAVEDRESLRECAL